MHWFKTDVVFRITALPYYYIAEAFNEFSTLIIYSVFFSYLLFFLSSNPKVNFCLYSFPMLSCFVSLITVTTTLFFLHCFLMVLQWCLRFIFAKLQTHMELPSVQGIRASWALRTSTPLKSKSSICKMLFTLKRSAYMYNCDQNHSLFPPFIFVNAFDQSFWLCLLVKRFLFHSAKKTAHR